MERHYLGLSDSELDRHVYRIMRQEHVVELFSRCQNVLCQVHKWKDKFENFQLELGGKLDGQRFQYGFKDAFVGQCWTLESLSEAMWGIYANDPNIRFVRIRSTPRKLLTALVAAHPEMPQETCFIGKVQYKRENELQDYVRNGSKLNLQARYFAKRLLLKRNAFRHESEVRLLYFGDAKNYKPDGLYQYRVDPHAMITQIMADPNRDRSNWQADKTCLKRETGFSGEIKRSKIYDPPEWELPTFTS